MTRASNCPPGTQFPLSQVWRTTRVPARTGAGPVAAGSARRPALGLPTGRAGGPRSRSRSRLGAAVGPTLTSDCGSGFTHLTAPPTTAGRPASLSLTSADPPPGSDLLQLRTEPRQHASSGSGPAWGEAREDPAREAPRRGGRGDTPTIGHAPSWGKVDGAGKPLRSAGSFPVSTLSPDPTFGRHLCCYSASRLIGVCCPHLDYKLQKLRAGVQGSRLSACPPSSHSGSFSLLFFW